MSLFKNLTRQSHWLIRLSIGATFLYHGIPKLYHPAMMPFPPVMTILLGLLEVGGVLLLLTGGFGKDLATRVAGGIHSAIMIGAILIMKIPYGFNSATVFVPNGFDNTMVLTGWEFELLILVVSLNFLITGNAQPAVTEESSMN